MGEDLMVFTNPHPIPQILETRSKIANPRLANLAKNPFWKERLVLIDGALNRCYKSLSEKNLNEP
jgi:hypothetical protein